MGQSTPYTKLSDLLESDQRGPQSRHLTCGIALGLFTEVLRELQAMSNAEREETMKQLTAWMLIDNFGTHARGAIQGVQKYCIAECLIEDPTWVPSVATHLISPSN